MNLIRNFLFATCLLTTFSGYGQSDGSIYRTDGTYLSGIKITADGGLKKLALAGGVNNPQFATPDLNKDGKRDLVIFEAHLYYEERGVKTFLNTGTPGQPNYHYAPEFEYLFPTVVRYLQMVDYNCDGVDDLFHNGRAGLAVCDGYYNSNNALTFDNCRDIKFLFPKNTIPSYVSVGGGAIPAIADVDGDDDIDMITFSSLGNVIHWYKNIKTEKSLNCDTFAVQLRDVCWGRMLQNGPRKHELHINCDNSSYENQPKTTDGTNSLCLFDSDGDGDYDVLNGNSQFSDIQYMKNSRAQYGNKLDSMIDQDTTWQSGGHPSYMPRYPLAAWVDIDHDGDKDILISPMAENAENYKCIQYYKNYGSNANPNFIFNSDTFLVDQMIDLGSFSYPIFYDYNRDGKPDLLVGARGYYQPNGKFKTNFYRFENTSTTGNISFNLVEKNFLSLDTMEIEGAAPAIGDLDNDGIDDLVVGRLNGTLSFYKNYATSPTAQPDWRLWQKQLRDKNIAEIDAGNYAAPVIYDMDKDGKDDLVIGNETGYLYFYKNTGVTGQLSLELQTNKLGNVKVEPDFSQGYSAPFIGRMDNINKDFLLVGTGFGRLYRYDGFQNGDMSQAFAEIDTQYSGLRMPAKFVAPAVADLDGDGKYEMFVGNEKGGLLSYRQVWNVGIDEQVKKDGISLYPNPASNTLTIKMNAPVPEGAYIRIYNSMGQLVRTEQPGGNSDVLTLDIDRLPAGVYLCALTAGNNTEVARFTVLK